jgi:flagellar motor switch protein FliN/FliY
MIEHDYDRLMAQLETFGDLMLTLSAELDQTAITYEELLDLRAGSIIQLQRPTGENIAVYAENVLLGYGEVLLIDEMLTVRLAEIQGATERHSNPGQDVDPKPLTEATCA